MTNGTATKSKVADSTSMVFYPNATGNWTISCQYDGETYYSEPNPVVVSSLSTAVSAEISLVHIPEGATVTPTDDIQTWLHCANIWNKSYTTLAEVLADRETYETLIADSNACDYMARSTTWALAEGSVPQMTSNTTPKGEAYCNSAYGTLKAFYVFDRDTETGWHGAQNIANAYVTYIYEEKQIIRAFSLRLHGTLGGTKNIAIFGANTEDSDVTVLYTNQINVVANVDYDLVDTFSNDTAFDYYGIRFTEVMFNGSAYIALHELQFYEVDITRNQDAMSLIGKYDYCSNALLNNATWAEAICNSTYFESVLNVKVPVMTSNTTPSGVAYVLPSNAGSGYEAYRAFDGNSSTMAAVTGTLPRRLGYHFTQPINVKKVVAYSNYATTKGILRASNDNSTWEEIKILNHDSQTKEYIITESSEAFTYWEIESTQEYSWGSFDMYSLQFYGRASEEVLIPLVPTMTSDTTPSGRVIYDSQYNSTTYAAWKAFDKNTSSEWSSTNTSMPHWCGYDFEKPVIVNMISLWPGNDNVSTRIKDFKIQGSNTGNENDWNDIYTGVAENINNYQYINFNNSSSYRYYRIYIMSRHGSTTEQITGITELQFYQRTVQTNIIHSAANDTIYMLEDGVPTPICRTNEDGDGIFDFSELEEGVYTFGSTVAKNPSDLTEDFKKRFRITKTPYGGTTERYLLPDTIDTLYWFGREDDNLEDMTSANGWTRNTYTFSAPTHNTTDVDCNANGTQVISGIGSKNKITSLTKTYAIAQGVTAVNSSYGNTKTEPSKAVDASTATSQVLYDTNTSKFYQGNLEISNNYLTACCIANRRCKVSALWYTRGSNDIPTFISAANDTLYIMDGSTKIFVANTNGEGKSYEPLLEAGTYTIYSSVAKDPNNLSSPYSKTVTVDESTQTIALMPENTLYWWGYMSDNLEDMNTANGWSYSGTTFGVPSKNTNSMRFSTSNGVSVGVGSKNKVSASKVNVVTQGVTVAYNNYGFVTAYQSKSNWSGETSIANASLSKTEITSSGDKYIFTHSASGRAMDLYAFWYE